MNGLMIRKLLGERWYFALIEAGSIALIYTSDQHERNFARKFYFASKMLSLNLYAAIKGILEIWKVDYG